jgi:predicted nucleotidyltransferase
VIPHEVIERAGRLLAKAAPPNARIVLFGSHARGEGGADSDLDLLVVEPETDDWMQECVRLRRALDVLRVPADVVVVSEAHVAEWGEVPGTLVHDALAEGRLLART